MVGVEVFLLLERKLFQQLNCLKGVTEHDFKAVRKTLEPEVIYAQCY